MKLIIKLFSIFLVFAGIVLLISPDIIFNWVEGNMQSTFFYILAIAVRLVIGVLLVINAAASKYPRVFKVMGYLFILASGVFIFMGQQSFQEFITSLIPHLNPYAAVSGLLSIGFGGFLFYAFSRK